MENNNELTAVIKMMDDTVRCLSLEVPESISKTVKHNWETVRESYAASRSVGYSLEQVALIALNFAVMALVQSKKGKETPSFKEWSVTDAGKSLLGPEPVGVQEPTALEFARFLEENTRVIYEDKITLYRYEDAEGPGNYILDDIYTVFREKWEPESPALPAVKGDETVTP